MTKSGPVSRRVDVPSRLERTGEAVKKGLGIVILMLFLATIPLPIASSATTSESSEVTLYLKGASSEATLTPFQVELSQLQESESLANAVNQDVEVGSWSLDKRASGEIEDYTWSLSMNYNLEGAAGAQINGTVEVRIGGETFTGQTNQGGQFLPQGTGTLNVDIPVESAGTSTGKVTVTLYVSALLFSAPSGQQSLTFLWGDEDHMSSIDASMPLLDMDFEEPETEGKNVYIHLFMESPWGDAMATQSEITLQVDGETVSGDMILSRFSEGIRITWTWTTENVGQMNITTIASITVQPGMEAITHTESLDIFVTGGEGGGGGGFYPSDEPLYSNGDGSPLSVSIQMEMYAEEGEVALNRQTSLTIEGQMAYWLRWGLDNIGRDKSEISQSLSLFSAGSVGDEHRQNRVVDQVEISEFEIQMRNIGTSFLGIGMAMEADELLGKNLQDFEIVDFDIDLLGESKVITHPIKLTITTLEAVDQNSKSVFLRSFIIAQPANPHWTNYDLEIMLETDMLTGVTGPEILGNSNLKISHSRTPFSDTIKVTANQLSPEDAYTFEGLGTSSIIHAPLTLSVIVLFSSVVIMGLALRLTKNRVRKAIYLETPLFGLGFATFLFGYPPLVIFSAIGILLIILVITAMASPKTSITEDLPSFPVINCPSCDTPNAITSNERPLKIPCGGCGKVLKIVG